VKSTLKSRTLKSTSKLKSGKDKKRSFKLARLTLVSENKKKKKNS